MMGAGCRVCPFAGNHQIAWIARGIIHPFRFAIDVLQHLFGQGNGGAAGGIFFLGMMDLLQINIVFGVSAHECSKVLVQLKKQIDAYAEIAGIEQTAILLPANPFHFCPTL